MLDKLFKFAVIVLAVAVSSALIIWLVKPTEAISQQPKPTPVTPAPPASSTPMYAIPESHEWEAITNSATNSNSSFLIYNKKSGEAYISSGVKDSIVGSRQPSTIKYDVFEFSHMKKIR